MFRDSTLMKRIVVIVLCALAASTVLAVVAFTLAGRSMTFQASIDESFEQADSITTIINNAEDLNLQQINDYILSTGKPENKNYVIMDTEGIVLAESYSYGGTNDDIITRSINFAQINLITQPSGNTIFKILDTNSVFEKLLIIRTEFSHDDDLYYLIQFSIVDENNELIGQYLNILILSALAAAFFMLLPAVIFVERITEPLQDVNEIAREYEKGIYTRRANENVKGEVGELAASFNSMADKLSLSITTLTTERNNLDEIFNVISEGIMVLDSKGVVTFTNHTMNSLFSKVAKKNLFTERLNLIPFEEVWSDVDECITSGESKTRDLEGSDYAYRETIVPRFSSDGSNTCIGATAFFRDITDDLKMERTRNDYVANISHELRTPLQTLRGLIEPLSDGMVKKEEDRQRYYDIILNETLRLSRLIDDMLELSKLQSRTLAFKTFPFDLNTLLNNLKTKFDPIMADANISFKLMFNTGKLPTVIGNPDRVEQILIILLDNAKKYTPANGTISISAEYNDIVDKVLVSVSDTGQGIHEFDINHIFDRFYKADRARGKKGTGLGLSIAKELLAYMGEDISVESEYGKGTTFTFTLKKSESATWFE